jgi:hypothetical protein
VTFLRTLGDRTPRLFVFIVAIALGFLVQD